MLESLTGNNKIFAIGLSIIMIIAMVFGLYLLTLNQSMTNELTNWTLGTMQQAIRLLLAQF
jgi:hypothetical protein